MTTMTEIARRHFDADMLLKRTYGRMSGQFKGCSIGCFFHDIRPDISADAIGNMRDKHAIVAAHFGYPEWLAYLQDTIFEGLPDLEAAQWHVQFAETIDAIPDGYDWQSALHRVRASVLRVAYRMAGDSKDVVKRVLDLHEMVARGDPVSADDWSEARSAAESAAWSTDESAAWAAAAAAARTDESAARTAESAAAAYQEIRDAVLDALKP